MIKHGINFLVAYACIMIGVQCSLSNIQKSALTTQKCSLDIKEINQTVFHSGIGKIFFGQFSTANYKFYEADLFYQGKSNEAVQFKFISFAGFPAFTILGIILFVIFMLYKSSKAEKDHKFKNQQGFYAWEIIATTVFICGFTFLACIITLQLKVVNTQFLNQLDSAKCALYNGVDVALNGDKTQNWVGFNNINEQVNSLAKTANTISQNFQNQKVRMEEKITLSKQIIKTQVNIQRTSRISVELKPPKESQTIKVGSNGLAKIKFSQIIGQISKRQLKNEQQFVQMKNQFKDLSSKQFSNQSRLKSIQEVKSYKQKTQQFYKDLVQYEDGSLASFKQVYSPIINIYYDVALLTLVVLFASLILSVVCDYRSFNKIFKIAYYIIINLTLLTLILSYYYLHYGIFIHSTCQVAEPMVRSGKLDKFSQSFSPFNKLSNCFKSNSNFLNQIKLQSEVKAINELKQSVQNYCVNQNKNIEYYGQWIKSINFYMISQQIAKLSDNQRNDLQSFKNSLNEIKNFHQILMNSGKLQSKIIEDFSKNMQSSFSCGFVKNQVKFLSNVMCTNMVPIFTNLAIPNLVLKIPFFLIIIVGWRTLAVLNWLANNADYMQKKYAKLSTRKVMQMQQKQEEEHQLSIVDNRLAD